MENIGRLTPDANLPIRDTRSLGIVSRKYCRCTLPETNIAPENGWNWNTIVSFWGPAYFQVQQMLVSGSVHHELAPCQVDAHNVVPVWAAWSPQYWQDRSPSLQIPTNHQSLPQSIKGRIIAHCGGMTPKLYP